MALGRFALTGASGYANVNAGGGTATTVVVRAIGFAAYTETDFLQSAFDFTAPESFHAEPFRHLVVVNGRILRANRDYTVVDSRTLVFDEEMPAGTSLALYFVPLSGL
jgi:hypothetical protein